MGVQARELHLTDEGLLEDIPVTRQTHPLVRYAEKFTRNFDLIAERKSSIYQLREVAKATVMAKFLMDSNVCLEDEWFALDDAEAKQECVMELPQLWNMRGAS